MHHDLLVITSFLCFVFRSRCFCRSVFGASLKMVTFYGLFTYFTHSLFGFQVVVFPAGECGNYEVLFRTFEVFLYFKRTWHVSYSMPKPSRTGGINPWVSGQVFIGSFLQFCNGYASCCEDMILQIVSCFVLWMCWSEHKHILWSAVSQFVFLG